MKISMPGAVWPFCICMALLVASCKKNGDVPGEMANAGNNKTFSAPTAFKKQVTFGDAATKITLLVSGNDEQAVNAVAASQFRLASPEEIAAMSKQQASGVLKPAASSESVERSDPQKAVHIAIQSVQGSPMARASQQFIFNLNAPAGALNPTILIYSDVDGVNLRLRKNFLGSNNFFGVSAHVKVIGIVPQWFGAPWGDVGFALMGASTDPNGILCNRLLTEISRTTVNQQLFFFQTDAW